MSKWEKYKLGDVVTFGNGKERPKAKGTIPVYGGNGILDFTNDYNYDGETIVIGRVGAYCGSVYYADKPIWVSDNALAAKVKGDNNPQFLYYFLRHLNLNGFAEGSSHPLVTQRLLNSIDIIVPDDVNVQKTIASILSSLDDKIDLLNHENATIEQIAETIFRQWFIEDAKDEWEEVVLEDVAILNAGGDKPKMVSQSRTSELNVPIYSNGIDNEGLYGYTDSPRIIEESVTISARGTIGYVVLRTEPFVPIVRLITIRPKEKVTSKFLYYWAKAQNINGTGTTQQQLTVPDFKQTKIVLPEKALIDKFTNVANQFYEKIISNKRQIQTLINTRNGLLPKLMSNEIRLKKTVKQ
jgi:type I restriction enzyme S subunit